MEHGYNHRKIEKRGTVTEVWDSVVLMIKTENKKEVFCSDGIFLSNHNVIVFEECIWGIATNNVRGLKDTVFNEKVFLYLKIGRVGNMRNAG